MAVVFAAVQLVHQWGEVRRAAEHLAPRWSYVALSCLLVFVAYAILVEVWRTVLGGWHARLPFFDAARIWMVSNLGRYVPGKVWQIGAMAMMAQQRGISGVTAGGSAVISTVISTVAGFAVAAVTGANVLHLSRLALAVLGAVAAAILLAPVALPWLARVLTRITRREIALPRLSPSVAAFAVLASAATWCVYGLAFHLLVRGLVGETHGGLAAHIAMFTGSYLIGFLAIFAPGGIIVREALLATALRQAGYDSGAAILLVVASRLWLTVLEIVPALLFLVLAPTPERRSPGMRV